VTFNDIMTSLSKMYNSYDATCWLNKERPVLKGYSAAQYIKDGKVKEVARVLQEDPRYQKVNGIKK